VRAEAYEAYLKGRYFWNKFARPAEWKALEHFQKSIELDPDYAPAHAGLASAYGILSVFGAIPPREGQPRAGAAARRALELDDTLPTAHVQLGFYQLNYLWDFAGATSSFRRGIELDPSSSAALHGHATALVVAGRVEEAVAEMRRAIEVDPLWLLSSADLCGFFYFARRYDAALAQCNKTLEMEPEFPPAHYYLGEIYEAIGRHDEAFRSYQTLNRLMGADPNGIAAGEDAWAKAGWKGVTEKWLEMHLAARRKQPVPAFYIADSYLRVGRKDEALEWLERACEERHYEVVFLKVSPKFDILRSDPRFDRLLRRMGLADRRPATPAATGS
jgi:tetratricopeptide (TPR) repeat protein